MKRWIVTSVVFASLTIASASRACPMCKDSIPNSENADAALAGTVPVGFNYSVYYMLGGLFLCIGLSTTAIVKAVRDTGITDRNFPQNKR
jgi:hypothetical protein